MARTPQYYGHVVVQTVADSTSSGGESGHLTGTGTVEPVRCIPRPLVVLVSAALTAVLAAGCSSSSSGSDGEPATPPGHPSTAPALWNPCDGLEPPQVARLFRTTFTVDAGTPSEPACRFTPAADGDVGLDVNYQIFAGSLEELFATFGTAQASTEVTTVRVRGADDARLVVDTVDETLLVTGFVQNGRLVQVVNALDPDPAPRARVVAGVRALLTDLSAHADESAVD